MKVHAHMQQCSMPRCRGALRTGFSFKHKRIRDMTLCRASITIDTKDDASPVTEADRKAEEAMRQIIMDTCPSHEILGEEHGLHHAAHTDSSDEQGYRWVLDPIDGTKSFITGNYCNHALMHCDKGAAFV